ncbi:class I SAM-dependent methyltransferase [Paenibacillus glycanilyticus]|uniref:Methyltransferase n=1 Tax=Paenibacillus glycanilyticus TaxID=126569 RepID=A0ABQ6GAD3_9BACL|nr:class I SAM-dependent methyltransferase [Paenibacillus glycanilyticus]GLX67914.1 methyltransferase [Paenibacillus glycanilyticus]
MNEQSAANKLAWEHRAYEFWNKRDGSPQDKANKIMANPKAQLKKHQPYFEQINGKKVANLCGSNGRKAVPLALLGAEVTVFDISEENKRYALELADAAGVSIEFVVTDLYEIDLEKYSGYFDMLYLEGGILHYFDDIERLMSILFSLLKHDGEMVLSDFHPLRRCLLSDSKIQNQVQEGYFDEELHSGHVPYKKYFDEQEQQAFPEVSLRLYTLSEILNAVITSGFKLMKFEEHRGWNNENIPWEFTLLANK